LESYRKKGIGSRMMKEFLSRVRQYRSTASKRSDVVNLPIEGKLERILLLSHDDVRRFYERLGFVCKGKSDVVLGREVWYEMRLDLDRN
jgi:GNAT superfamily N-acetyltransferase